MFDSYVERLNELQQESYRINEQMRSLYMQNVFLTWRWWLCVAMVLIPWIVWIKIRDKARTARLLFAGSVTIFIAMLLDDIGVELNFWDYHVDIDAINPSFILWDMTLLPIATMILLQYKPKTNPLIKAVVLGAAAAFAVEPLFAFLGFYDPESWRYIYSLPIYIVIYLIAHFCYSRQSFEPA